MIMELHARQYCIYKVILNRNADYLCCVSMYGVHELGIQRVNHPSPHTHIHVHASEI